MFRTSQVLLAAILHLTGVVVLAERFDLCARIEPAPALAEVTLRGVDFPFSADTRSDSKGQFQFKRLDAGVYTVEVVVPGFGTHQRTVAVSSSLAGTDGRVRVTIPFQPSDGAAVRSFRERTTISFQDLCIPPYSRALYEKARKELSRRRDESARKLLLRAVEVAPTYSDAWDSLGMIASQSGEYELAEKYFRKALESKPEAYSPLVNLGGALLLLKRYREALEYNTAAYAERPEDALVNGQLGMNYFRLGDYGSALAHLKHTKRIDPSHFTHPQLLLAEIYAKRGRDLLAAAELEDFLARHPDSPSSPQTRRWLADLKAAGRTSEAPDADSNDSSQAADSYDW